MRRIIFSQIQRGNHIDVYGEHGMGKTSLLHYIASPEVWRKYGLEPSQVLVVYVDCQVLMPFSPKLFWQSILLELEGLMEGDTEVSKLIAYIQSMETISWQDLRKLFQILNKRGRFLVLLLDEFDVALQPHEGYSEGNIRALRRDMCNIIPDNLQRDLLSYVVATRQNRLSDVGPSLTESDVWYRYYPYEFLLLKPFDENETRELLAKMPEEFALSDQNAVTSQSENRGVI